MNSFNDKDLDRWLRESAGPSPESPAPDGWDTPPEAVWEHLRAGLDQRKQRRRLVWAFGSVLLLGLAGAAWYALYSPAANASNNTSGTAAGDLAYVKPAPAPDFLTGLPGADARSADSVVLPGSERRTEAGGEPPVSLPSNQAGSVTNHPGDALCLSTPPPLRRGGRGARPHFTHPSRFGMPNVDRGQAPLPFGGEPVPYFSREDGGGVETSGGPSNLTLIAMEDGGGVETPGEPLDLELMALKAGGEVSRTKSDTPPLQSIPLSPIHPHKNRIRLTAGLANGVFFSARQVKSAGVSLPNGRESGAWTWQQGISLGLRLSPRWTVETGLQRTAIRLQAERLLRFRYRINQEQFDQQRFLYQNSANDAMETAFGAVELRMDVGREPSRPIDDLTVFRIVLQTEEQARYWRVPLGLRWSAPARGRWQWSLNGGVGFNFSAGYTLDIKSTSANRPGIRGINARRLGRAEGLAPFMADLQIGGRMGYRLSSRCSLSLTPEFRYGLTSMYRQGPFRSLAVSGGVTAGLNWQF